MIRPSPEIAAVVTRWNRAVQTRDTETLRNLLSRSDHLIYQGSADGECWSGDILRRGFPDHVREIPAFEWIEHDLWAFENGETGWALCHASLTFLSNGKTSSNRFTFVLTLEAGAWKIAHMHVSNSVPNIEKIGVEQNALNRLVAAAREGFRLDQREGLATVMFTDVVNSTAIAELLGDRIWAARIAGHLEEVQACIAGLGGQFVKSLGDGSMSSFPSARAAMEAAVSIQRANAAGAREPPLSLRIGLHTGDVIQTDDDFFGSVVNKAARVAAAAPPDQIRVTDAVRLAAGGRSGFGFGPPETAALKGLAGEHTLFALDWQEG